MNFIKNIIRKYRERNWGSCPNCGTNWVYLKYKRSEAKKTGEWIKQRSIRFKPLPTQPFQFGGEGILICNDCLDNPERLDSEKIYKDLLSSDWSVNDALLAKKAIDDKYYEFFVNKKRSERLNDILNEK